MGEGAFIREAGGMVEFGQVLAPMVYVRGEPRLVILGYLDCPYCEGSILFSMTVAGETVPVSPVHVDALCGHGVEVDDLFFGVLWRWSRAGSR